MEVKRIYIYESENKTYIDSARRIKPLQLYITIQKVPVIIPDSNPKALKEISIRGKRNPLPFTKAIIEESHIDLDKWLYNTVYRYKRVGEIHHSF